jgi:hypothetical protein
MLSRRIIGARNHSKFASDAAGAPSTFPYVPLLAVALSAPIAGIKSGIFSVEQLPEGIKAVLADADQASGGWLGKFVLSAGPPAPRVEPPALPTPSPSAAPAAPPVAPDPKLFLEENKQAIIGLLFRELAAVRGKESRLGLLYQPLTMWRLRSERRAIVAQLAVRDAHE